MNTKRVIEDNTAACQCAPPTSDPKCMSTHKAATKSMKESAKEMVADVVTSGKEICAASEKAVLEATDKALRATSHATAKASRSVRKTLNS